MIYDHISRTGLYKLLGDGLARGLDYLSAFSMATAPGKYPIDGDRIFALVQHITTASSENKKFESHRSYIDIQCVFEGHEVIEYAPVDQLQKDPSFVDPNDTLYLNSEFSIQLLLAPQHFAIFFPCDGHKPGCLFKNPGLVKKVVVKVRCD